VRSESQAKGERRIKSVSTVARTTKRSGEGRTGVEEAKRVVRKRERRKTATTTSNSRLSSSLPPPPCRQDTGSVEGDRPLEKAEQPEGSERARLDETETPQKDAANELRNCKKLVRRHVEVVQA
jgi:hypothetical protein